MALEDYRADMERCSRCSYCKWIPFDQVKSWRFAKGCPSIDYNKFQRLLGRWQISCCPVASRGQEQLYRQVSGYSLQMPDVRTL